MTDARSDVISDDDIGEKGCWSKCQSSISKHATKVKGALVRKLLPND